MLNLKTGVFYYKSTTPKPNYATADSKMITTGTKYRARNWEKKSKRPTSQRATFRPKDDQTFHF